MRKHYPDDHRVFYARAYVAGPHRGGRKAHICPVFGKAESVCECSHCGSARQGNTYRRQRNRQRMKPYGATQQAILSRLAVAVDGVLLIEWGRDSSRRGRGSNYGVWGQRDMRAYMELRRMGYVAVVDGDERNRYSEYAGAYALPYNGKVTPQNRYLNQPRPEKWEPHLDVRVIRLTTDAEREQFETDRKAKVEDLRKRKVAARYQTRIVPEDKYKKSDASRDPRAFWGDDYDKWGHA